MLTVIKIRPSIYDGRQFIDWLLSPRVSEGSVCEPPPKFRLPGELPPVIIVMIFQLLTTLL